jgi:hypothetical protein
MNPTRNAVVLVSGGMDSAVTLAIAKAQGYVCYALSVEYGQRHSSELSAAQSVAARYAVAHKTVRVDLRSIGGSALTDDIDVPEQGGEGIPVTYVPARNTIMLSIALGWAEVLGAQDIFCGVNAVDYSGYPDCRHRAPRPRTWRRFLRDRVVLPGRRRRPCLRPLRRLPSARTRLQRGRRGRPDEVSLRRLERRPRTWGMVFLDDFALGH